MAEDTEEQFSPEDAARRRDEIIRRMIATPPKPHKDSTPKPKRIKSDT
jgi:hypothetical protein